MIKNIPYLQQVKNENIINDILYLIRPKRFEAGMVICKRGDNNDQLMLLKSGYIGVEVPRLKEPIHTVTLKEDEEEKAKNKSENETQPDEDFSDSAFDEQSSSSSREE